MSHKSLLAHLQQKGHSLGGGVRHSYSKPAFLFGRRVIGPAQSRIVGLLREFHGCIRDWLFLGIDNAALDRCVPSQRTASNAKSHARIRMERIGWSLER